MKDLDYGPPPLPPGPDNIDQLADGIQQLKKTVEHFLKFPGHNWAEKIYDGINISGFARVHLGDSYNTSYHGPQEATKDSSFVRNNFLSVAISVAQFSEFCEGLITGDSPINTNNSADVSAKLDILFQSLADSRAVSLSSGPDNLADLVDKCKKLHRTIEGVLRELEREQHSAPSRSIVKAFQDKGGLTTSSQSPSRVLISIQNGLSKRVNGILRLHLESQLPVLAEVDKGFEELGMQQTAEVRRIRAIFQRLSERCRMPTHQQSLPSGRAITPSGDDSTVYDSNTLERLVIDLEDLDQIIALTKSNQYFLRRLHFSKINARLQDIPEAHASTFKWVFEDRVSVDGSNKKLDFAHWLSYRNGMYWIQGKPGSGKSTLMKYICVNQLSRTSKFLQVWAGPGRILLTPQYFFWLAGSKLQRSKVGLLRSLLFEILREFPAMIAQVSASVGGPPDRMASDYDGWQSNILLDALRYVIQECKAIKQSPIKFCFFIDGLDELEEFKSQDETHTDLVKTLKDLSELPGVKLCISSRPYHAFRTGFEDAAGTLKLEDLTRNDMLQYAKSQLDKNEKFRNLYKSSREYQGFIREISIRAEGVFLWVRLVTRDLLNLAFPDSDTIGTLYRRLGKCPVDLDDFFDKTIQRIDPRNLPQAARIFWLASHVDEPLPLMVYWLLCELPYGLKSFQPQSLGSTIMSDAEVSTRSEEMRALLDQCSRGLLEIVDGERGTGRFFELKVDFIHRSVRDFLRQPDASGTVFQGHKFIGFQNNERLVPCVALLAAMKRAPFSRPVTAAAEMLLKQLVLFAQDAQENMSGDSADLVTVLHETEKAYLTAREKFQLKSDSNLLLGLACQANLFDYVKTKAEKELRVAPSKFARPPLSYALQTSPLMQRLDPLDFQIHLRIVKLLLDKGADPHRWHPGTTPPWNGFISSVLQNPDIATSKGVLDAISYLVSRDVDTSMKFNPLSYDEGVHQLYYSPGKPKSTHEPVPTVGDEIKKLAQRLQVKISYPEPQSEPLHVAMQGKRIVVVGAGIAGLAFVIGLRKYWPAALIPPKIALYDWSIPGRPDNAGNYSVYLSGPHEVGAHNVLKDLGLLDEALRCAVTDKEEAPNDYFAHFTGSIFGGTDAKVGLQSPGADAVTVEQYRIPHESVTTEAAVGSRRISYWDLHRIMLEAVEKTDEVFWEVNCQNVVAREDGKLGVWLTGGDFEGGHLSLCDLVVAADGVSSTVKACLQSRSRPMMADYQVGGIATFPDGIPPSLRTWGTRSAQDWFLAFPFCSYTTTDEIHVIWDLNSSDRLGVDHLSEPKKLLEACHDGIDELPESKVKQLQTLINATHTTAVSFFDRKTKNQVLNRSNKNIVFVGDSNYPFGSRAGDGGSLALMDGWDLAKRLTEATELTAAIDAYQKDSVSRATNLLKFWGQDALYGGVQVVSFVFTALKQLGNMFLIFLKK